MSAEIARPVASLEPVLLARVRLRAERRFLFEQALVAAEQGAASATRMSEAAGGEPLLFRRGLLPPEQLAAFEARFQAEDPTARHLGPAIARADEAWRESNTFRILTSTFGLSEPEVDLLTLAISVEASPWLADVFAHLSGDAGQDRATPWLATQVFEWPELVRFAPSCALHQFGFARPEAGATGIGGATAPWIVDPFVVDWALAGARLDPALGGARLVTPGEVPARPLHPETLESLVALANAMLGPDFAAESPLEIDLVGPSGAGKRTLGAQLCARLNVPMLEVDAGLLLGPDIDLSLARERAIRAARCAMLSNAVLYWHDADRANAKVWSHVRARSSLTLFGAAEPPSRPSAHGVVQHTVRLPALTRAARLALWSELSASPPPPEVADFLLMPGDIAAAARVAAAGPEAVAEACRPSRLGAEGHLSQLPCPYAWDDIVLTPAVELHLRELMAQLRLRWDVYEDWGFRHLCPLGGGITALFGGPSGTGKTMAAQVVARSLRMDLYRVDLASVVSKYIGETEKNLKQVFDACERANAVLFFDEADALFGQRTQVKDAHDRFANIEIDYLLQRMEQYSGLAILATNRKGDLDTAFLRRVRFIIDFVPPGPSERLLLWQKALTPKSPSGEDLLDAIDWHLLARGLDMTGADIKAAALGAAFLARADGCRIGMRHILRAAGRELTKRGIVLRPGDLGGYSV